jgi:hypothetical protein
MPFSTVGVTAPWRGTMVPVRASIVDWGAPHLRPKLRTALKTSASPRWRPLRPTESTTPRTGRTSTKRATVSPPTFKTIRATTSTHLIGCRTATSPRRSHFTHSWMTAFLSPRRTKRLSRSTISHTRRTSKSSRPRRCHLWPASPLGSTLHPVARRPWFAKVGAPRTTLLRAFLGITSLHFRVGMFGPS